MTKKNEPAIIAWNRLEPRPRKADFDRTLRAEIRDPLWMLCRQWQFGEFVGEDAGTAVKAVALMETTQINRYAVKGGKAVGYNKVIPLETRVERENIPMDLSIRIQIGTHWINLLKNNGLSQKYKNNYLAKYPFEDPTDPEKKEKLFSDQHAWQMLEAAKGRIIDGGKLMEGIKSATHTTWLNSILSLSQNEKKILNTMEEEIISWFNHLYSKPAENEEYAWSPPYLEYQLSCSAPEHKKKQTVLVADQYHHGHLDWYSFDIDSTPNAKLKDKVGENIKDPEPEEHLISFILSPIEFAGMPNVRWWEMEDRKTDFGDIKASTTDVAKLLLAEFGLIYGNDWSIIPFDINVGSLARTKGIVVTDVFGQHFLIRAAGRGVDDKWQRWSMYNLNTTGETGQADNRLFLPSAIGKKLEGKPVEEIHFIRDEMANMVWAVEKQIPGSIGKGKNGYESAVELTNYFKLKSTKSQTTPSNIKETNALIKYVLGTTVPENWIPFIPVHVKGSSSEIQLQMAAMPRLQEGGSSQFVSPRGIILKTGQLKPVDYKIEEIAIQRAGINLTRSFQLARSEDGTIHLWIGRQKQTGRGEGSSGLKFDQIESIESETDKNDMD